MRYLPKQKARSRRNMYRDELGQFAKKRPTWKERAVAPALLLGTVALGAWLQNPITIERVDFRTPVLVELQSPVQVAFGRIDWNKEPELISPLAEPAYAYEEGTHVPEPTPEPEIDWYAVPEGFPEPKMEVQRRTVKIIREEWGEDADLGIKLAWCESTYGANVETKLSSARGVFQFIKSTWIAERKRMGEAEDLTLRFDIRENVRTAYSHYKRNGLHQPWAESVHCVETGSHK